MRIAIVVYDHADEKNIALANDFISAGHCVKFVYFKRNATDKLPKEAILTVLDCKPSIFAAINPLCGLRKWTWAIKRWNDTDIVICPDKKTLKTINFALMLDRAKVSISLCNTQNVEEYIRQIKFPNEEKPIFPTSVQEHAKILMISTGGIGDTAQSIADAELIKSEHPDFEIWTLVKQPAFVDFVASQACMNGVIVGCKKPMSVLWNTAKKVRTLKFDWITDISGYGGHSVILQCLCNVPNKFPFTAAHSPRNRKFLSVSEPDESTKQKISALEGKKIFVCVGAGGSWLKQWPNDYWAKFLNMIATEGWQAVFCGSGQNEKNAVAEITAKLPDGSYLDLVNETSLSELTWIASQCQACVGNDTGLLHIAALAGVPSIGLFSQPTAWRVGLRMPWFHEIHATNEIKKFRWENKDTEYVLDRIKPEEVYAKFRMLCESQLQENSNDK